MTKPKPKVTRVSAESVPGAQGIGQLFPPRTMFLRVAVGDVTAEDGTEYNLTLSTHSTPLVKSAKSGRIFSLSWAEIIKLAHNAGVDTSE